MLVRWEFFLLVLDEEQAKLFVVCFWVSKTSTLAPPSRPNGSSETQRE